MNRYGIVVCSILLTLCVTNPVAQIIEVPIAPADKDFSSANSRVSSDGKALFPVWEDFSNTFGRPDTCLWINSQNVWINDGGGINKPSIHVATFDGNDGTGQAYSSDVTEVGYSDSLVSRPIDMTTVPAGFEDGVFLTFFYQREGNGEFPDAVDFIEVQFRGADSLWTTIWPADPDDLTRDTDIFQRVSLKVDPVYFHDDFQFRFRSFGRRAGPYDTWHIDYIYLDKDQSENSLDLADRAITEGPASVFGNYTAIPIPQFRVLDQDVLAATQISLFNYQTSQLVQAFEYSAYLINEKDSSIIETLADGVARTILGGGSENLPVKAPDYQLLSDELIDDTTRLDFRIEYIVNTGDTLLINTVDQIAGDTTYHEHVDLRLNDTVSRSFTLHDFYAYDDGSAEFGAGINQNGGQIAYQYVLKQPDTLVAVDMYFTNIGRLVAGNAIDLFVLKDLTDEPSSVLYQGVQTIQNTSGINVFGSYPIEPLVVRDTIYIGFRQSTDIFLPLGLDKNTNTGDRIFFNIVGTWEQNTSIQGSLMLRPRFGKGDLITALPEQLKPEIRIYPNPARTNIRIEGGSISNLSVVSIEGKRLQPRVNYKSAGIMELDVSNLQAGIYLLQFTNGDRVESRRIIIAD